MKQSGFSRRDLLKALGIGAAGIAAGSRFGGLIPARAQDAAAAPTASAFYNLAVGEFLLTIVQEGKTGLPANFFGSNVSETAAPELLAERGVPLAASGLVTATINIALLRAGERLALIDTGLGDVPFPGSTGNQLIPTLALLGITPDQITDVIISHFHADHVGGLSTMGGEAVFSNATVHFPEVDWDFVQNTSGTPLDDQINLAKLKTAAYLASDQFSTYAADAELFPGVTAIATPGHTPGHVALRLSSGDAQLVATSDTANHPILALANPDWNFAFDADPTLASETRRAFFGMLADEQLPIFTYHFPFPGVGYVTRAGDGFTYIPNEG